MKPKIFNTEEVRSILDGTMTEFRQEVKPVKGDTILSYEGGLSNLGPEEHFGKHIFLTMESEIVSHGPFGKPGNQIYVRETFSRHRLNDFHAHYLPEDRSRDFIDESAGFHYWADGNPEFGDWETALSPVAMPKAASRITLEVTNTRVERTDKWYWVVKFKVVKPC